MRGGGGTHSPTGKGGGGPNSFEGTDTTVLLGIYVLCDSRYVFLLLFLGFRFPIRKKLVTVGDSLAGKTSLLHNLKYVRHKHREIIPVEKSQHVSELIEESVRDEVWRTPKKDPGIPLCNYFSRWSYL